MVKPKCTVEQARKELERLSNVAVYKNAGIRDKQSFLRGFLGQIRVFEHAIRSEEQQKTMQV